MNGDSRITGGCPRDFNIFTDPLFIVLLIATISAGIFVAGYILGISSVCGCVP